MWHTTLVVAAVGSVVVTNVRGVALNRGPDWCCHSEASDKAFVGSTATGVELLTLDVDTVLFGNRLVTCIMLIN